MTSHLKFMLRYETQDKTNEHTFKTSSELQEFAAGLLFMPVQSIRKYWYCETMDSWEKIDDPIN